MSDAFASLFARARDWSVQARRAGWLEAADLEGLERVEQARPGDLFVRPAARPLVVAFFGGTGVGKSSLLNRLVGAPLARTGPERPTSRELTLYVHQSVELGRWSQQAPVTQVRCVRHSAAARREVAWIDAPDIDSTHAANRRTALRWLPHIDLLIYVVSPERYRDDAGWRLLLERGHKHAWMFVINRWDEGDRGQCEDFARMLRGRGFSAPLLLCTSCRQPPTPLPSPDQFDQIDQTIRRLLAEHARRQLERLGERTRLLELRAAVSAALARFGQDEEWERLSRAGQSHWRRLRAALLEGLEWPLRAAARRLAARDGGPAERLVQRVRRLADRPAPGAARQPQRAAGGAGQPQPEQPLGARDQLSSCLWDEWAQAKLEAALDAIELELRRARLPAAPLRQRLDELGGHAGPAVLDSVQDRLRAALALPGTRLARALRRVTGFLMALLPALALAWVAAVLVRRYYLATTGAAEFLGVPFAVHSGALVLAAWALPFLLDRRLRPSVEKTALRALRGGLAAGLDDFGARLAAGIAQTADEARRQRQAGQALVAELSQAALRRVDAPAGTLARLLATPAPRPAGS